MTDMRTPLKTIRGLGSAKSGTDHFWRQRVTAISNIPLVIAFIFIVVSLAGESHETAVATLGSPFVAIVMTLAIISVSTHMYLGIQVVIEDYVHEEGSKVALRIAALFYCLTIALVSIYALLRIGLTTATVTSV